MVSGKTKTGFEFSVDENAMNDMRLVDMLADKSVDPAFQVSNVLRYLLPGDQRKKLYEHVQTETGRVPVEAISNEIADIFAAMGESGKNS